MLFFFQVFFLSFFNVSNQQELSSVRSFRVSPLLSKKEIEILKPLFNLLVWCPSKVAFKGGLNHPGCCLNFVVKCYVLFDLFSHRFTEYFDFSNTDLKAFRKNKRKLKIQPSFSSFFSSVFFFTRISRIYFLKEGSSRFTIFEFSQGQKIYNVENFRIKEAKEVFLKQHSVL